MSDNIPTKNYPSASDEVAKMLGLNGSKQNLPVATSAHGQLPVANLPASSDNIYSELVKPENAAHNETVDFHVAADAASPVAKTATFLKIVKATAPYLAVFGAGLLIYYFFFTGVNFGSIFKSTPKAATPKQTAAQQLESSSLASYQKWIKGFYYDVTDPKIIDPETDNSGNGLSNFQKYLLNLNPKAYDTLGLGQPDSQSIAAGIDPSTGASLNDEQKAVISKYIDMEVVMNRLTLNRLQHPEQVAGAQNNSNTIFYSNPFGNVASANQGQNNHNGNQNMAVAPKTGADLNSGLIGEVNINTDIPGRLEIPDLKVNVPVIWSKDPSSFDKDLQIGVVHYPGTALPGQIGTTYIAGHSSNYVWAKGDFNHVFTHLGDLADNTSFKITVVQKNGKDAIFHYVVTTHAEYLPTDQAQFANGGKSVVALSTCWPINSTAKRLVVFGELTQIEK